MDADPAQAKKDIESVGANYDAIVSGKANLTMPQITKLFDISLKRAQKEANKLVSSFQTQPDNIKEALTEITFVMGEGGAKDFSKTLALIDAGKYEEASKELLDSKWAREQAPSRAQKISDIIAGTSKETIQAPPKSSVSPTAPTPLKISSGYSYIPPQEKTKVVEATREIGKQEEEKSTSQFLLSGDISLSDKIAVVGNGVTRGLEKVTNRASSSVAEIYSSLVGKDDTPKYPDAEISKQRTIAAQEKTKALQQGNLEGLKRAKAREVHAILPAESAHIFNVNKLKLAARNRDDFPTDGTNKGTVVQVYHPIYNTYKEYKKYYPEHIGENKGTLVLNKVTGKLKLETDPQKIEDRDSGKFGFTVVNTRKIVDINLEKVRYDSKNKTGTYFPQMITADGKSEILSIGTKPNNHTLDNGAYGGKLLLLSEDGANTVVIQGSASKIREEFHKFKTATASEYLTYVALDQGSYNRIKKPENSKNSKDFWKDYQRQNIAGSYAFYIQDTE